MMMAKCINFTPPSPHANIASAHLDVNLLSIQLVDMSLIIFKRFYQFFESNVVHFGF